MDQGGAGDGARLDADEGEDEGDGEEDGEDGEEASDLLGVEQGEEDAGRDGREDERHGGDGGGGLPAGVGLRGARQREPVVGDGEGGDEEAAEGDLLEGGG